MLTAAVNQRKRLIRMGKGNKDVQRLRSIIMMAEEKLNRFPSEESVKPWIRNHYEDVRYLIPAKNNQDKRVQLISELL